MSTYIDQKIVALENFDKKVENCSSIQNQKKVKQKKTYK